MPAEVHTVPFTRSARALFGGGFVTFSLLYSVQPLLPALAAEYRISPATASLSLSASTAALAVSMLAAAALSDRQGRKPVMAAALAAASLLGLLVPLAHGFPMLLAIRLLMGVALAGLPAVAMTYLAEEVPPERLGLAMGLYISGNAVGGMSGRIVVGILTDALSWRASLGLLAVVDLAVALWFWRALPSSRPRPSPARSPRSRGVAWRRCLADPGLGALFAVAFLLMGSFVPLYNYVSFPLMAPPFNLSHASVGLIFVLYLVGTVASPLMGRLADRGGRGRVLGIAIGIQMAGAFLTMAPGLILKILGIGVFTFGFFGGHAIAAAWVGARAVEERSAASALYLLAYYAGASVGGWLGGHFFIAYGWGGVVGMVAAFLTGALGLSAALERRCRVEAAEGGADLG